MNKIKKIILKKNKTKIICLTAYSKNISSILDKYTDIILVGDSLGSVLYNFKSTRQVNISNMIDHAKSVRDGVKKSLMVVDMPYDTYKNKLDALKNAKKIVKETKCEAIKLEGGKKIVKIVKHLINNKINVMGHLGVLPQNKKENFKSKGKLPSEKNKLIRDAKLLEKVGVFSIVLECVHLKTAKEITKAINIPTIGIGSSLHCDGQVLVTDDLIGLNKSGSKFVKKFINLRKNIEHGIKKFREEVLNKKYPSKKYSY